MSYQQQAFPRRVEVYKGDDVYERYDEEGMTLHQYFAGQALAGIGSDQVGSSNAKDMAILAILIADAMIDEYERRENEEDE